MKTFSKGGVTPLPLLTVEAGYTALGWALK